MFSVQLFRQILDDIDRYPAVEDFRDGLVADARNALATLAANRDCFLPSAVRTWGSAIEYLTDPYADSFSTGEARLRLSGFIRPPTARP